MARSHVLLGAGDTTAELSIRRIGIADLKDALRSGLADFNAMPTHAMFLCLIYPVVGLLLARLAFGYSVLRIRYAATMFGGAMSGLAGAYLSLSYTPMWTENMVAGRGWIALALVVFSTWKPGWLVIGAWLFGFVTIAQFQAEGWGLSVSPHLLAMLPYLATILVLVLSSRDAVRLKLNAPAALGKPFHPTA